MWVMNDGVHVAGHDECKDLTPHRKLCAYFNGGSRVEIPFFANNYQYEAFSLSLWYKRTGGDGVQGLVSNDWFEEKSGEEGNSLFVSSPSMGTVSVGLKSDTGAVAGTDLPVRHHTPIRQCRVVNLCS